MITVLFACVHNAGRSQMAAAFFNALADPSLARAVSAGTEPAERVHPEVVAVSREVGIDLAGAQPRRPTKELAAYARLLVTMGCGEACPVVPGLKRDDWPIQDPKGQPIERVREIRGEVLGRVKKLITREGWALTGRGIPSLHLSPDGLGIIATSRLTVSSYPWGSCGWPTMMPGRPQRNWWCVSIGSGFKPWGCR